MVYEAFESLAVANLARNRQVYFNLGEYRRGTCSAMEAGTSGPTSFITKRRMNIRLRSQHHTEKAAHRTGPDGITVEQ